MSSAHRPTWVSAVGGAGLRDGATSAPTNQFCSKDQPGHKKLKYRKIGQDAPEELASLKASHEITESLVFTEENEKEETDEDIVISSSDDEDSSEVDNQSEESDSDDDSEELLRELEKIKKEREIQRLLEQQREEEEILRSNPLLNLASLEAQEFTVKRRWDDDVIFKNQAKGIEQKPKKRFINDTTRSDFHRKFLDKYIR